MSFCPHKYEILSYVHSLPVLSWPFLAWSEPNSTSWSGALCHSNQCEAEEWVFSALEHLYSSLSSFCWWSTIYFEQGISWNLVDFCNYPSISLFQMQRSILTRQFWQRDHCNRWVCLHESWGRRPRWGDSWWLLNLSWRPAACTA